MTDAGASRDLAIADNADHIGKTRHRAVILAIGVTLAASAAALALMGRIWVCGCGYVQLWAGNIWSADNSQHLTDAYPFAHFTKGLGFF